MADAVRREICGLRTGQKAVSGRFSVDASGVDEPPPASLSDSRTC